MAHHLVFIPCEHEGDRGASHPLATVGLPDHVADAEAKGIANGQGPDGKAGTLYAWRKSTGDRRMHIDAALQTWLPAVADGDHPAGRYYVGVWNDAPPAEGELRRADILSGDDVMLGDGTNWHVAAPDFLPHDLMLRADGTVGLEPKRRYQDVCLEAKRWARRLLSPETQTVPYLDLWRFGLKCLGLNYRLPGELAAHLRLVDESNVKAVMMVACRLRGE